MVVTTLVAVSFMLGWGFMHAFSWGFLKNGGHPAGYSPFLTWVTKIIFSLLPVGVFFVQPEGDRFFNLAHAVLAMVATFVLFNVVNRSRRRAAAARISSSRHKTALV